MASIEAIHIMSKASLRKHFDDQETTRRDEDTMYAHILEKHCKSLLQHHGHEDPAADAAMLSPLELRQLFRGFELQSRMQNRDIDTPLARARFNQELLAEATTVLNWRHSMRMDEFHFGPIAGQDLLQKLYPYFLYGHDTLGHFIEGFLASDINIEGLLEWFLTDCTGLDRCLAQRAWALQRLRDTQVHTSPHRYKSSMIIDLKSAPLAKLLMSATKRNCLIHVVVLCTRYFKDTNYRAYVLDANMSIRNAVYVVSTLLGADLSHFVFCSRQQLQNDFEKFGLTPEGTPDWAGGLCKGRPINEILTSNDPMPV
eukprot:763100-Hanusia_phi.AAC.15